jgi:hypothetical protein
MFDFYDRAPFATDYDVLKPFVPGFDVANIGGFCNYHTPNDNLVNVNLRSLQHHGSYAMGFARHFGNMPLDSIPSQSDAVYFNPLGSMLIHYPDTWAKPLAMAVSALFLMVLIMGIARSQATLRGVMAVALGVLLAGVCAVLAMAAMEAAALAVRGVYVVYNTAWYGAATVALAVCVFSFFHGWFRRRMTCESLALGALVWCELAMVHSALLVPGASYLQTWPLLFALVGLGICNAITPERHGIRAGILVLTCIPGILVIVPVIFMMFMMVALLGAPVIMVLLMFAYAWLVPQFDLLLAPGKRWLPAVSGVAAIVLLTGGILSGGTSPAQPRMNSVSYMLNVDSGEAFWTSTYKQPDEWTEQFFPANPARGILNEFGYADDKTFIKSPAPVAPLPAPEFKIERDDAGPGGREVALHILSPRGAASMMLDIRSEARFTNITVNGLDVENQSPKWRLYYDILPHDGIHLTFRTDPGNAITVVAVDSSYALPTIPEFPIRPRPPYLINEPNTANFDSDFQSDKTQIRKSFTLTAK